MAELVIYRRCRDCGQAAGPRAACEHCGAILPDLPAVSLLDDREFIRDARRTALRRWCKLGSGSIQLGAALASATLPYSTLFSARWHSVSLPVASVTLIGLGVGLVVTCLPRARTPGAEVDETVAQVIWQSLLMGAIPGYLVGLVLRYVF